MNLSGILVVSTAKHLDPLIESLNAMPGVEVHNVDRDSNRFIAVQEAATVKDEVAGLKKIKQLPGIVLADMVYHYIADDEGQAPESIPDDLDRLSGIPQNVVPEYLNH